MALATTMLVTSFNVVYAQDAEATTETPVVETQETAPADTVATGGAASGDDAETPSNKYGIVDGETWPTTSPWKATVFGSVGSQERIDNYGNTESPLYKNGVMPYDVKENGDSVQVRMGIPDYNDPSKAVDSQGKISSDQDGIVMYYQQLKADDDFTISATAHVNGINNANNQVSFGATVRDKVFVNDGNTTDSITLGDYVTAGPIEMLKTVKGDALPGDMSFAYTRKAGALSDKQTTTLTSVPQPGDDIPVSIKKSGTNYTVTFGTESAVIDGSGLSMTDDIYVGFFASRCADITYNNVKVSKVGEAVEAGEMTIGGNGFNGNDDPSSANYASNYNKLEKTSDSAFKVSVDAASAGKAIGKLSNSEDSYTYYASEISKDDDFVMTGKMKLGMGTTVNPKEQGGSGLIVFDSKYRKDASGVATDVANGVADGNSVMAGAMVPVKPANGEKGAAYLCARVSNDKGNKIKFSEESIGTNQQDYADEFTYTLRKSGTSLSITINGSKQVIDVSDLFAKSEKLYVGYFAARDAYVDVTDHKLSVGSSKVASIELNSLPNKTDYYVGETFDSTGLALKVVYENGTTDIIDSLDDITLTGFEDTTGGKNTFTSVGEKEIKASIGSASVTFNVNVRGKKVTDLKLDYLPVRTDFLVDTAFDSNGLTPVATFEDGTTKTLTTKNYKLYVNGKELPEGTELKSDLVGKQTVTVMYTDADTTIDPNNVGATYDINVKNAKLESIRVGVIPDKTNFVQGESFDDSGLIIEGKYVLEDGTTVYRTLDKSLYTYSGYDLTQVGNQKVTVTYKNDPSVTVSYDILVTTVKIVYPQVESYPLLTYMVGDTFNPTGLKLNVLYNTGKTQNIDTIVDGKTVYYLFDGSNYYDSEGNAVEEAVAKAATYYIDLSQFSTASEGTGKVYINVNTLGVNSSIELVTTTTAKKDYVWKGMLFGASSMGVSGNPDSKSSQVILTDNEGNQFVNDSKNKEFGSINMTGGKLDNVSSVRLNSWTQSGKQSGDQDGKAYFYTLVDAKKNFKLSADVTVNRYIADPADPADDARIRAKMASAGVDYTTALDMLRTGQEMFGLEARDVIPFAGGIDADGNYTGGLGNHMTTDPTKAMKDDDGTPVDIYEAYIENKTVTDKNKDTYAVSYTDVENTFASNIVVAGATTDSTYPTDTKSSTYYTKSQMNRINILIRTGVVATDGGGERVGIKDTTDTVPVKGDKYNITLQKINEGYMITTYDYQTGQTQTEYDSLSNLNLNSLLDTQNDTYMTVGLSACRWADATFENIELHEIDPNTDKVTIPADEKEYSPKLTMISSNYSTTVDYMLSFKANNPHGGQIDVSQNGNIIIQDGAVSKKTSIYNTTLVPDSVNEFTIVYKPSTADNCVSFEPVVTRFNVTQKSNIKDFNTLYVAPDGAVDGDGTRENPLDLESAIGMSKFGTTIVMLDGTYNIKNTEAAKIEIGESLSGKADGRKTIKADEGAHPVLDLEGKYEGFSVSGSYWTFDGIEVKNAMGNGKAFYLGGHYDEVKNCTFHDNGELGFQISRLIATEVSVSEWPSNNLVLNCESYNNNDPSKNNADGFACKLTAGYNNVFSGCSSHHNLDDGWDCYTKLATGAIGPVQVENCVAYRNGYQLNDDASETDWGNGAGCNGFKMGGENIHVAHYLKDCISWGNKRSGVDSNYNPGFKMRNVISYNNEGPNIKLYSGTGNIMKDENGSQTDANKKPYKFDYDMKGVVSCADPAKGAINFDQIGSVWTDQGEPDTTYGNLSKTPIVSENNYITYYNGEQGKNSNDEYVNPENFFESIDPYSSIDENMHYTRRADGSFNWGPFLARKVAYVHDAGDEVVYPDVAEKTTATTVTTTTTETTTEATTSKTETTTKKTSSGGGSGAVINSGAKVTTTEATTVDETATEVTTGEATEATTSNAAFAVNPPKADGADVTFKDVPATHWANDAVSTLAKAGVVNGLSADTFGTATNSKRGDFVVMLVRALGIDSTSTANFSDVDSSKYYAKAIATAKAYGIVNGYNDNTFKPENYITRQDMMVMVANALNAMGVELDTDVACLDNFSDTVGIANYARTSVAALVNAGIVKGSDNKIEPVKNITRAEMAQLVKGVYDKALTIAE